MTEDEARRFFGGLYEEAPEVSEADWAGTVTQLVAKIGTNVVQGDQALQSLMVSYVMNNADDLNQVKKLSVALAGIKQAMITEVLQEFPNANVNELLNAAREAGYEVQVLR